MGASHPDEGAGCFLSLDFWMGHLGASSTRSGETEDRVGKSESGNTAACSHTMMITVTSLPVIARYPLSNQTMIW